MYSSTQGILLDLLRSRRESLRLRQTDLATRLGRDQATVSKVESGERRLDVIELRAWLGALEMDFLEFMVELDRRLPPLIVVEPQFAPDQPSQKPRRRVRET